MVQTLEKKTDLKKKEKKKVEQRRWDKGGVLYRIVDAWVVREEELKELKKMRWHLWH